MKVVALCLLPWPLVAAGLYFQSNMWVTFFLYHWLLLFPVAVWKRSLWVGDIKLPTARVFAAVLLAAALTNLSALFVYDNSGKMIVDSGAVSRVLEQLKYDDNLLVPLVIYFFVFNPVLEELFWRGSVQNLVLKQFQSRQLSGIFLTAIAFGAWHYLVLRVLIQPGAAELFSIGIVLVGFALGLVYKKSSSLLVSVLVHSLVFDLPVILVLLKIVL